jgi:hypothetical protein
MAGALHKYAFSQAIAHAKAAEPQGWAVSMQHFTERGNL